MSESASENNPLLNIDAAKAYISSAEKNGIQEPARAALKELRAALEMQQTNRDDIIDRAKAVEASLKKDGTNKFTVKDFEATITQLPLASPDQPEKNEVLPREATAEYIIEKVYDTKNEILIDGAEILLSTLNEGLKKYSLTPHEKENIKIGILGYVFEHYYEVLGGIRISDLQKIFSDLTKTFSDVTKLTQPAAKGEGMLDSITNKWNAMTDLVSGGSESLGKVSGFLDNTSSIDQKVQAHIVAKFGLMIQLLENRRPSGTEIPPDGDRLSGFLSDPQNIIDMEKKFPATTVEELEGKISQAPVASKERTADMAWKLKKVFENKTAILDKVTSTWKNILDTFADSLDTSGPMSWWRDVAKWVLKFLAGLPFIWNFIKALLWLDPSEDIDAYFGEEKRFQRLSAKSLRTINESGKASGTLLEGKNLVNVTTKRIAKFTKAYLPHITNPEAKPEEKVTSISPDMWKSIIVDHKLPIFDKEKKQKVFVEIKDTNLHIDEWDFSDGKPQTSFFDKINKLDGVLSGSTETVTSTNKPQDASALASTSEILPEGKTKKQIADTIIKEWNTMVTTYIKDAESITDKAKKSFMQSQLKSISDALRSGDIKSVKVALVTLNTPQISKELTPEQQKSLTWFNSLITSWESAPETIATAPDQKTEPKTTSPEPKPADTAQVKTSWKDTANIWLDGVKSWINKP